MTHSKLSLDFFFLLHSQKAREVGCMNRIFLTGQNKTEEHFWTAAWPALCHLDHRAFSKNTWWGADVKNFRKELCGQMLFLFKLLSFPVLSKSFFHNIGMR